MQKLLNPAIPDGKTWSKFDDMVNMEKIERMKNINQMTQKSPEDF